MVRKEMEIWSLHYICPVLVYSSRYVVNCCVNLQQSKAMQQSPDYWPHFLLQHRNIIQSLVGLDARAYIFRVCLLQHWINSDLQQLLLHKLIDLLNHVNLLKHACLTHKITLLQLHVFPFLIYEFIG